MSLELERHSKTGISLSAVGSRVVRADACLNRDEPLETVLEGFGASGVGAIVREITDEVGVAAFQKEVLGGAGAASVIAAAQSPGAALDQWMQCHVDIVSLKRGLGSALHSGDAAYEPPPAHFLERLGLAPQGLLDAAVQSGEIQRNVDATELLLATTRLCVSDYTDKCLDLSRRLIVLLIDGLRHRRSGIWVVPQATSPG